MERTPLRNHSVEFGETVALSHAMRYALCFGALLTISLASGLVSSFIDNSLTVQPHPKGQFSSLGSILFDFCFLGGFFFLRKPLNVRNLKIISVLAVIGYTLLFGGLGWAIRGFFCSNF